MTKPTSLLLEDFAMKKHHPAAKQLTIQQLFKTGTHHMVTPNLGALMVTINC